MSPRIGIHTSIAPNLTASAEKAAALGCDAFQIFTSSPRMWRGSALVPSEVRRFLAAREKHGLSPLVVHDNYLINLPAVDSAVRANSIAAFRGELERAVAIEADYLVLHPGSSRGQTAEQAIETFAQSLAAAAGGLKLGRLKLLFENTAGGGESLGRLPEELHALRRAAYRYAEAPIAFCIDTAHCFQGGLDFFQVVQAFDSADVPVFHANDSRTAFGSRHDRHEHIGKGGIGREGFRRILSHPSLRSKTFILETPIERPGDDRRNVRALKVLAQADAKIAAKREEPIPATPPRRQP
jgi:deoxyribonuclease-4